jgi:hypothetical protein
VACGYGFDMHPRVFKCHAGVQLLDIKWIEAVVDV